MEEKIKGKLIFKGKVIHVYHDEVKCSNGILANREVVRHLGGAAILFINSKNEVLLIKQFRYVFNEELYEIPAGKLEISEDPMLAAKRELEEETGYHSEDIKPLGIIYPTVGYSDEKIYLYLVEEATLESTHFDIDEDISSAFYPLKDVLEMIQNGIIKDAKTICAIHYYLNLKGAN